METVKEKFITLMIKNCNLVRNDPIKLFFFYMVWFFIYNAFAYTIEKLVGVPTVVMWYDLVALLIFTFVYAINIFWLMAIMDVRAGATRKVKEDA